MYEQFYGLRAKPFRLSPDPHFFFTSATHKSALACLRYGLYQGEGFIVVTGAAGTGKTTLVLTLLGELSSRNTVVGELVTTQLQADDLLRAIAAAFHLDPGGAKSELLGRLQGFFSARAQAGRSVLLVVDEAHNLPQSSLEELRMLSNFHSGTRALLQCVLLGQPPLRDMLSRASMEQLQQRVIAAHHLHPLGAEETRGYILHRLRQAGWRGDPTFSAEAVKYLQRYTQGIPRRINSLCDRLLLYGFLEERHHIDVATTTQVYSEWAQETGQMASVEPLLQRQMEEVDLAGLDSEHAAVGPAASPAVAPVAPPVPSDSPEPRAPDASTPIYVVPPRAMPPKPALRDRLAHLSFYFSRRLAPQLRRIRPLLKPVPMAGVAAALVAALTIALWPGRAPHEHAAAGIATAPAVPAGADKVAAFKSDSEVMPAPPAERERQPPVPAPEKVAPPSPPEVIQTPIDHVAPPPKARAASPGQVAPRVVVNVVKRETAKPRHAAAVLPPPSALSLAPEPTGAPPAGVKLRADTSPAAATQSAAPVVDKVQEKRAIVAAAVGADSAPGQAPSAAAPALPISERELTAVLARFRGAYEAGNMQELVQLFARDARSDEERDREAIARAYQKLFNVTDARRLALKDVRWQEVGEAVQGEGHFGVTVREKGRDLDSSYTGNISLRIEKRDGQAVITELDHSYAQ